MAKTKRKELHPVDQERKQQKKKDILKNKKVRQQTREIALKRRTVEKIDEEIDKIKRSESMGTADEKLLQRKKVLEAAKEAALKKQKEDEEKRKRAEKEAPLVIRGLTKIVGAASKKKEQSKSSSKRRGGDDEEDDEEEKEDEDEDEEDKEEGREGDEQLKENGGGANTVQENEEEALMTFDDSMIDAEEEDEAAKDADSIFSRPQIWLEEPPGLMRPPGVMPPAPTSDPSQFRGPFHPGHGQNPQGAYGRGSFPPFPNQFNPQFPHGIMAGRGLGGPPFPYGPIGPGMGRAINPMHQPYAPGQTPQPPYQQNPSAASATTLSSATPVSSTSSNLTSASSSASNPSPAPSSASTSQPLEAKTPATATKLPLPKLSSAATASLFVPTSLLVKNRKTPVVAVPVKPKPISSGFKINAAPDVGSDGPSVQTNVVRRKMPAPAPVQQVAPAVGVMNELDAASAFDSFMKEMQELGAV